MNRRDLIRIAPLLRASRYEVLPTARAEDSVLESVPTDVTITVTASPAKGLGATFDLTERLARHGYHVVPHLSARLVRDGAHRSEILARLTILGIDDVFVPAGDAESPTGDYDAALGVLERLTAMGGPFAQVGITGYPQSHPTIGDDVAIQSMWDKRRHATYIVSNLCFDAAALRRWISRIRARGVSLPLLIGLAGPVERAKLLAMATKIGVGDATRFLSGHSSALFRLGAPGAYQPQRLLEKVGPTLTAPDSMVAGLHIFTFNQLAGAQAWRADLLSQLPAPSLQE